MERIKLDREFVEKQIPLVKTLREVLLKCS